jgi:hypothetical protein
MSVMRDWTSVMKVDKAEPAAVKVAAVGSAAAASTPVSRLAQLVSTVSTCGENSDVASVLTWERSLSTSPSAQAAGSGEVDVLHVLDG